MGHALGRKKRSGRSRSAVELLMVGPYRSPPPLQLLLTT